MEPIQQVVAKNLAFYRERKGLSQRALAKELGLSRSTIHAYEKGAPGMKLETLSLIAKALYIEEWELFKRR